MPSFRSTLLSLSLLALVCAGCDSDSDSEDRGDSMGTSAAGSDSAPTSAADDGPADASDDGDASDGGSDSAGGGDVDTPEPGVVKFEGDVAGMPFSGRCDATTGSLVSSGLAGRLTISCTHADMGQLVFVVMSSDPESPFSYGLADAPPTSPTHAFTLDGTLLPSQPVLSVSSVFDHLEAITIDGTWDGAGHLVWTFDATWSGAPDQPGFNDGSLHGSGDIVITEL